jgi:hypothetical protein
MKPSLAIILARILLALPLLVAFLVLGERAPEMFSFVINSVRRNPLL